MDNPYSLAALMLGSFDNETQRSAEALTVLKQGQTWAPTYVLLAGETGAAYNLLHQPRKAYENYAFGLANAADSPPWTRGILLRGEGYALTELKRYDEAESVYREALSIDPNHGRAAAELSYIAGVKAGRPVSTKMESKAAIPALPHN